MSTQRLLGAIWAGGAEGTERIDPGVDGNARLTAATAVLLFFVLLVEGVTILRIRQLISIHVFVGLLLIPPVLLKTATTGYRFLRFYTRHEPYVRKGPPHLVLRLLGPVLVVLSLAVLATGVGLIVVGPDHRHLMLFAHQATFVGWLVVAGIHVLGHARETVVLAARDWQRIDCERAPGRRLRLVAVALTLVAGVGLGAGVLPLAGAWTGPGGWSQQFRPDDGG